MRVETLQTLDLPENKTFIEEFTLSYGETGLLIYCRSKVINAWAKRFSQGVTRTVDVEPERCAFNTEGKKFYYNLPLTSLDPLQSYLTQRDHDNNILVNVCFLALEGLDEGAAISVRLPVSQVDATDYYHACLQFFQQLYSDYIRPFSITALMREVDDATA